MKVSTNVVEVTNSFAVPHQEVGNDEVAVGKEFNSQMFALLQLVNPMEKIVGWYATAYDGKLVVDSSSLIHEFFTQVSTFCNGSIIINVSQPIGCLLVDWLTVYDATC